jgi:hypothetical protein
MKRVPPVILAKAQAEEAAAFAGLWARPELVLAEMQVAIRKGLMAFSCAAGLSGVWRRLETATETKPAELTTWDLSGLGPDGSKALVVGVKREAERSRRVTGCRDMALAVGAVRAEVARRAVDGAAAEAQNAAA